MKPLDLGRRFALFALDDSKALNKLRSRRFSRQRYGFSLQHLLLVAQFLQRLGHSLAGQRHRGGGGVDETDRLVRQLPRGNVSR